MNRASWRRAKRVDDVDGDGAIGASDLLHLAQAITSGPSTGADLDDPCGAAGCWPPIEHGYTVIGSRPHVGAPKCVRRCRGVEKFMRQARSLARLSITGFWCAILAVTGVARAQPSLLDGFDAASAWTINASDGVKLDVVEVPGAVGTALRLDYDFQRGSGFCTIKRPIDLPLPANYRFTFLVRGSGPPNNFEFKLGDRSGDNVWWHNAREFEWPGEWKQVSYPARKISFAWGPSGGKPIDAAGFIEFAIAAGEGGKGSVFLDELRFEPLPMIDRTLGPIGVRVSSGTAVASLGPKGECGWACLGTDPRPAIELDFGGVRECGGVVLHWQTGAALPDFDVEISENGKDWAIAHAVRASRRAAFYLPWDAREIRALRVRVAERAPGGPEFRLERIEPQDAGFAEAPNSVVERMARGTPRGRYPRTLIGEQCYWTVTGINGGAHEALINEDGAIEPVKKGPSLEPFVFADGRLFTWADGGATQSLEVGHLPIPRVTRRAPGHELEVTCVAHAEPAGARMLARYTVKNLSPLALKGRFFLAVRPFQVLPAWQALNVFGGVASVRSLAGTMSEVSVNGEKFLDVHSPGASWGAARYIEGDVSDFMASGELPAAAAVTDSMGWASGALSWELDIAPGDSVSFVVSHPWTADAPRASASSSESAPVDFDAALRAESARWDSELGGFTISAPPAAQPLIDAMRSSIAYVMINRDGPAIQPGSRTYERTWIRDGSLTSTAMLYAGRPEPVREFLDWFKGFQYENGKVPCCADRRGPDPVPENDSHGQYIYGVLTYYHFTGDVEFLRRHWPSVLAAAGYIENLIAQRSTPEYAAGAPEQRAKFGLVPESISHEGYSAKPMHSYWDCFFTLRGLKDVVEIAGVLGEHEAAARFTAVRDEFRKNLLASIRASVELKGIDFIPGCVELGDFDATSTAAAIFPCGELNQLPPKEMRRTFDRYFEWFRSRAKGEIAWNEYTPYEMRLVSVMVMLGERERAHEMLDFFMNDRRPLAWNSWGEIVYRELRAPKFIGDMPHTWVGSDFIKAVRNLFVYEEEHDSSLVIGAGVPAAWIESEPGIAVQLPTLYGRLAYRLLGNSARERLNVGAGIEVPPGGLVYRSPYSARPARVLINGSTANAGPNGEIVIRAVPAVVEVVRE